MTILLLTLSSCAYQPVSTNTTISKSITVRAFHLKDSINGLYLLRDSSNHYDYLYKKKDSLINLIEKYQVDPNYISYDPALTLLKIFVIIVLVALITSAASSR